MSNKHNTNVAQTGGVQGWSVGEHYPFIVAKHERYGDDGALLSSYWVITLGDDTLAQWRDVGQAHYFAKLFAQYSVRDIQQAGRVIELDQRQRVEDAEWALFAEIEAEHFAVSRREGAKRDRDTDDTVHGGVPLTLTLGEVLREKREQAAAFAARDAFYAAAEAEPAYPPTLAEQLKRKLGLIR